MWQIIPELHGNKSWHQNIGDGKERLEQPDGLSAAVKCTTELTNRVDNHSFRNHGVATYTEGVWGLEYSHQPRLSAVLNDLTLILITLLKNTDKYKNIFAILSLSLKSSHPIPERQLRELINRPHMKQLPRSLQGEPMPITAATEWLFSRGMQ